jgi:hypothetical protein
VAPGEDDGQVHAVDADRRSRAVRAQRALQQHLDAGRLQAAEFVERFAGAADAVTAADIAALFADLPAPHPTLPEPPLARRQRRLVIACAVAVLALVGLLGFVIGRGQATPGPASGAVAAPNVGDWRRELASADVPGRAGAHALERDAHLRGHVRAGAK